MMKKKSRIRSTALCLLVCILGVLYLCRVREVNKDNDKARIRYVEAGEEAAGANFSFQIEEKTLYESAAFLRAYENVELYYQELSEIYKAQNTLDALLDNKYVMCVKIKVLPYTLNRRSFRQDMYEHI